MTEQQGEPELGNALEGYELYRALVELSPDAIIITDLNTNIVMANMQAAAMFGYDSAAEMVGINSNQFTLPEDRERAAESARQVFAQGCVRDIEYTIVRKDGSRFPAQISASLVFDSRGRPAALLGIVRDISRVKLLDATVREATLEMQISLEAARAGSWSWDIRSGKVRWSSALEEIHGLPQGAFEGTFEAFQRDIHPEDREQVLGAITRAIREGTAYQVEYRILSPDGALRWVEGRGTVIRDETGVPARMTGICIDVTSRRRTEEALRRREQEFRALAENNPDLISRYDRECRYLYVNPSLERYIGVAADEIVGKSMLEVGIPPDRVEFWKEQVGYVFETGDEIRFEIEYRWPHAGRVFSVRLVPERGEDGEIQSVLAVAGR